MFDKAIDLLDEAGAAARLAHGDGYEVMVEDAEIVIAKMACRSRRARSRPTTSKKQLKDLDKQLRESNT